MDMEAMAKKGYSTLPTLTIRCARQYIYIYIYIYRFIQWLMFVQRHCFQQSFHQMMTLGSGMVSGLKHYYHKPRASQQFLTIPPDFIGLSSLYGIVISTLVQLELYLGSFFMPFLKSYWGSPRLVKNAEDELVKKPRHPTLIGNALVIQPFLTHYYRRSSYFFQLSLMCPVEIFFKRNR